MGHTRSNSSDIEARVVCSAAFAAFLSVAVALLAFSCCGDDALDRQTHLRALAFTDRRSSARAIAWLNDLGPSGVDSVRGDLGNAQSEVRAGAIWALVLLQQVRLEDVVQAVDDEDGSVRSAAIEAIARIAERDASGVEELVRIGLSADYAEDTRSSALIELRRVRNFSPELRASVIDLLVDVGVPADVRSGAALALRSLSGEETVQVARGLKGPAESQEACLLALEAADRLDAQVGDEVTLMLGNPSISAAVRIRAARVLAGTGVCHPAAGLAIRDALLEGTWSESHRRALVNALEACGLRQSEISAGLRELAEDPDPNIRTAIARILSSAE